MGAVAVDERWELYKLLSEPSRLRLLALASEEELAIGELAELLEEAQPNVSRHLKPLRSSGLVAVRKEGTRVFARLADGMSDDAVIADALAAGRKLCAEDGILERIAGVVAARDAATREFFEKPQSSDTTRVAAEVPAYLTALAPLLPQRRLAVDAGTGDGSLLDVLAPVFEKVLAVDRSPAQLDRARERLARGGYTNVELLESAYDSPELRAGVDALGGADVVFASRVLHHAPKPDVAFAALAALVTPGGALVVIDYQAHGDEGLRDQQADLWLGFEASELCRLAADAGLEAAHVTPIPSARCGAGADSHIGWQVLVARRAHSTS